MLIHKKNDKNTLIVHTNNLNDIWLQHYLETIPHFPKTLSKHPKPTHIKNKSLSSRCF